MSESDPFAPNDVPVVQISKFEPVAAPAPEKVADPEPVAEEAVPEGSIKEVLAWVGDDKDKAKRALEAEKSSDDPRKTLVKNLSEILD